MGLYRHKGQTHHDQEVRREAKQQRKVKAWHAAGKDRPLNSSDTVDSNAPTPRDVDGTADSHYDTAQTGGEYT